MDRWVLTRHNLLLFIRPYLPADLPADLAALGLVILVLAVCTMHWRGPEIIMPDTPEETVLVRAPEPALRWRTARSMGLVVDESPTIVIGWCEGVGEVFNSAHLRAERFKPDPDYFVITQVYRIRVERYLKGSGPQVLSYAQSEGLIVGRGADRSAAAIEYARRTLGVPPVRQGVRYLFFFRPKGYLEDKYVTGPAHPSRWVLSANGDAWPETPWDGADALFPRRTVGDLLGEVEPLAAGVKPTPTAAGTPLPAADVGWAPEESRVRVGETFTVSLAIRTVSPATGLQFGFDYDAEVVRLEEVSQGTFFGPWAIEHGLSTMVIGRASHLTAGTPAPQANPTATIIVYGLGGGVGPSGAGRVFELRFTALAEGATRLRLRDVRVLNGPSEQPIGTNEIPARVHDGLVTVTR